MPSPRRSEQPPSLAERFRAQVRAMRRGGRSPLYVALMSGAADDIDVDGVVAELFADVPTPPYSVPQLRLMAALHELVLSGGAPELARFYPSVGGEDDPEPAWQVARTVLRERFDWIHERLPRTVQTNEPGRSTVLFATLLWLAENHGRPIRLLELGASAGLNLRCDRFAYTAGDRTLGDPASPVRFADPWQPPPPIDLEGAQRRLRITARAGCDLAPLDPVRAEDRLRLRSYIWPDERERLQRLDTALAVAVAHPVTVDAAPASAWLVEALATRAASELTVVWHSVMHQYVLEAEWAAVTQQLREAGDDRDRPVVRLAMEPRRGQPGRCDVTLHADPGEPGQLLAQCGDHGPPVCWAASEEAASRERPQRS